MGVVVAKANCWSTVDIHNMLRVKDKVVDNRHAYELCLVEATREDPFVLMKNWMPRSDLQTIWQGANVGVTIFFEEFGDTYNSGSAFDHITLANVFNKFRRAIIQLNYCIRAETST